MNKMEEDRDLARVSNHHKIKVRTNRARTKDVDQENNGLAKLKTNMDCTLPILFQFTEGLW